MLHFKSKIVAALSSLLALQVLLVSVMAADEALGLSPVSYRDWETDRKSVV